MDPDKILADLHRAAAMLKEQAPEGWRIRVSATFLPPGKKHSNRITFEVEMPELRMPQLRPTAK